MSNDTWTQEQEDWFLNTYLGRSDARPTHKPTDAYMAKACCTSGVRPWTSDKSATRKLWGLGTGYSGKAVLRDYQPGATRVWRGDKPWTTADQHLAKLAFRNGGRERGVTVAYVARLLQRTEYQVRHHTKELAGARRTAAGFVVNGFGLSKELD